ncbi:heterokaryon incompatibility protein-domain-containing protein [Podospora aff. communis PSN243]|uniref:Heterokaryon incompatibility protein-domain-containing protein n=1 Tax=Podospora aff. communis PSN243 TaxID=3040156 RepID=A0AAV9GQD8_9PEZI|nr:heterokaryon incompatibility protein-domain-containing protein [Podospora aff. communis PSN243]
MPFCKDCLDMGSDPTLFSPDFSRTLKASFSDCEAAAAEGCQFCLLIKQSYDDPRRKEYLRSNIAHAAFLPARVLDLGTLSSSPIKLFCTGRAVKEPYVTLSHCWGKPSASRRVLKKDNLADMIQEIPYDRLTPVFRDAVTVTRHLGIRYLWIDALCIIQDSKEDWAEESVRMGDIYQNATLNVASACSPDSNTHFLRPRPAHDPEFNLPISAGGTIALRHRYQDSTVISSHLKQPLQSRAWCFQERVLSTRTVFFDELQFLWECRAGHQPEKSGRLTNLTRYSESYRGANRDMHPYVKPNFQPSPDLPLGDLKSSVPAEENGRLEKIFQHWYQLLFEYCIRSLTYYDDSLPALSAIAKYYKNVTGDTYLAGIWQKDMHRAQPRLALVELGVPPGGFGQL